MIGVKQNEKTVDSKEQSKQINYKLGFKTCFCLKAKSNRTTQYLTWFGRIIYIYGLKRSRIFIKTYNNVITKRTTMNSQNPKTKP